MKLFRCKGRDRDGNLIQKTLSGSDRNQIIHSLHKDGITPISVNEEKYAHKKSKKLLCLLVGLVSILTFSFLIYFRQQLEPHSQKVLITTSTVSNRTEESSLKIREENFSSNRYQKVEKSKVPFRDPQKRISAIRQLDSNKASSQEEESIKVPKPTGFQNPSDQLLAMALSVSEGEDMPPLPLPSDESMNKIFIHSLTNKIIIYPDDSPEVVKLKERVADAKEELAQRYSEGESIAAILKDYQAVVRETALIRTDAILQIQHIRKTQGDEAAEKAREEINTALKQEGLPVIPKRSRSRRRNRPQ